MDAALQYAALGLPVFPCVPGAKYPMVDGGFHAATTDEKQIIKWWEKWPDANIATPTADLVVIDIDGSENEWPNDPDHKAELADAPTSRTPRGGHHHFFRQPPGKLWRNTTSKLAANVDTRADGGYVLLPPSVVDGKPYKWAIELDCRPSELPLPPDWLVLELDGKFPPTKPKVGNLAGTFGPKPKAETPGDGNTIPSGQRNHALTSLAGMMRRAGMDLNAVTAAILSTNLSRCAPPLETKEVEKIAKSICRYEPDQVTVAVAENWAGQDADAVDRPIESPGPPPNHLLTLPGFVGEVVDYSLKTAPYPNPVLAFCGALALQSFLGARKVKDRGDNRTNLYVLGLAHSAAGKDWPRKVNARILGDTGMIGCLGDRFASGEGIQDSMARNPAMLYQTDEIDGMLQAVNRSKDARFESIMSILLSMYSASNSSYPMRARAGKESPGVIEQPSLTLFGTAIPNNYYEALSERMLGNGFFARSIVLESEKRCDGQEPTSIDIPSRIMETAVFWRDYKPTAGNLGALHPTPTEVPESLTARERIGESRLKCDDEYRTMEASGDPVGMTVWGRAHEMTRKLALIYAISENHDLPEITAAGVRWASELAGYCVRRMLHSVDTRAAGGEFWALCEKIKRSLRRRPSSHSRLLKNSRLEAGQFGKLIATLIQTGEIERQTTDTKGRPALVYSLRVQESTTENSG